MKNILSVSDPNVYARFLGAPVLHPLVNVIHYDEVSPIHSSLNRYGVYGLFIQRNFPKNLTYGMKMFDVPDGSIIAVEPGQIGGREDDGETIYISGWVLMFSPELLHGTDLEPRMKEYPFFSYFATETLKMEPSEWGRITQLLTQLRHELQENADSPALRAVILGYIRVILEYCQRIYLRQLSKEDKGSSDLLKRWMAGSWTWASPPFGSAPMSWPIRPATWGMSSTRPPAAPPSASSIPSWSNRARTC